MAEILVTLAVAAATFLLALTLQNTIFATRRIVQERTLGSGAGAASTNPILAALPAFETLSRRAVRMASDLDRAGVALTVREYTVIRVVTAVLVSLGLLLAAGAIGFGDTVRIIATVVGFGLGFYLPTRYVEGRRVKRVALIEEQLVDALTSMSKSLRTGLGLMQALDFASREMPAPLGPEMQRLLREIQLGNDFETVFNAMNDRIDSPDLEIASTAIVIQQRVGGNLSDILTNVANTIRERRDLRREVRIITSRQRLTGNVSALLPVIVAAIFMLINPETTSLLFERTAGRIALMVGIGFELVGIWLIRRFSVIEV